LKNSRRQHMVGTHRSRLHLLTLPSHRGLLQRVLPFGQ
jgi:hypothetical protein